MSISGVELQTSGSGDRRTLTPVSFVIEGTVPSTWGFVDGTPTRRSRPSSTPWTAGTRSCPQVSKSRPRSTRSSWSPSSRARRSTNQTYELPDGTIAAARVPVGRVGRTPAVPSRAARRLHRPHRSRHRARCSRGSARGPRRRAPTTPPIDGGHRFCGGPSCSVARSSLLFVAPASRRSCRASRSWSRTASGTCRRSGPLGAVGRRAVPVRARRRQPDRHAHGPLAAPGDEPPGDRLVARRPEGRSHRSATRSWRSAPTDRDGHPRSTRQRDPRLRECPVQRAIPAAAAAAAASCPRRTVEAEEPPDPSRASTAPPSPETSARGGSIRPRPNRAPTSVQIRSVRCRTVRLARATDVGAVQFVYVSGFWARGCVRCRLRSAVVGFNN